jgi:hypothetical protein
MEIFNIPVIMIWLYFSVRAKTLFFFTNVNPSISNSGMMGGSKTQMLDLLPKGLVPKMSFIEGKDLDFRHVINEMISIEISFPVILKPDIGERGLGVEKISDKEELEEYCRKYTGMNVILQEYIQTPFEIAVFCYHIPGSDEGNITSLCLKKMLTVTGDGKKSIEELMRMTDRARFQIKRLKTQIDISVIPFEGQLIYLEPIGNHNRGTKFLDGSNQIDEKLKNIFLPILKNMKEVYYGRFDVKCSSLEDLKKGQTFKIVEFNGVAGEAAHIYQPGYSIVQAYKDVYFQWKIIYRIFKVQKKNHVYPLVWKEFKQYFTIHRSQMSLIKRANK